MVIYGEQGVVTSRKRQSNRREGISARRCARINALCLSRIIPATAATVAAVACATTNQHQGHTEDQNILEHCFPTRDRTPEAQFDYWLRLNEENGLRPEHSRYIALAECAE